MVHNSTNIIKTKESLNSVSQQFHQYQRSEQNNLWRQIVKHNNNKNHNIYRWKSWSKYWYLHKKAMETLICSNQTGWFFFY
jgi:hypothetical protein